MSAPCGFPWHGLLIGSGSGMVLRTGDAGGTERLLTDPVFPEALDDSLSVYIGGIFGMPPEDSKNLHLVRVPGVAPLAFTPEEEAAHAALGRAWRNCTLLAGTKMVVNGVQLDGWICIDPSGGRWLVRPVGLNNLRYGDATIGSPLTLRFDVVPYALIGNPLATPVTIETTLADIQQDGETLGGEPKVRMRPHSIASHGRSVLIALYPKGDFATVNDFACGWLKLELTGDGPSFGLALSVIHSRTQALGTTVVSDVNERVGYKLAGAFSYSIVDRVMTGTMSGIALQTPTPGSPGQWPAGTRTVTSSRTGRVLGLIYDDADEIVTFSADQTWTLSETYIAPTFVSATGSLVATFPPGVNTADAAGRIDYSVNRSTFASEDYEVVIKRAGIPVDQATFSRDYSGARTDLLFFEAPGGYPSTLSPSNINASTLAPVWTGDRTRTDTFTVNGATVHSYTSDPNQSDISIWTPYSWGVGVTFTASTGGSYGRVTYNLQRVNNQLVSARYALFDSATLPNFSKTHRFIAAHATWDNPVVETDPFTLSGSYHPLTYELVAGDKSSYLHI